MDPYGYLADEGSVDLKEPIDMQQLQSEKGCSFEIDPSTVDDIAQERTTNMSFPGEEVFKNLLHVDESVGETADREGLEPFEVLERRMEDVTPEKDRGVMKLLLKAGTGSVVPHGALVQVHYNAYKELCDEPFDSSKLRHHVEKFRLGIDGTVAGMHVAVATMRKGEKSRFIFKPQYYFGELGCAPRVPKNCTALFDVELVSFVEREGVDDFYQMTDEERKRQTFAFVEKVSKSEKKEANGYFETKQYKKAMSKYKRAAKILDDYHMKNDAEEQKQRHQLMMIYNNLALCSLRLKEHGQACIWARKTLDLKLDNNEEETRLWAKAYYSKGRALHGMGEFDRAKAEYLQSRRLQGSKDVNEQLLKLEEDVKKFRLQDVDYKHMCARMVSLTSSSNDSNKEPDEKGDKEEAEDCSMKFRETVIRKLEEFKQNSDIMELPFPDQALTTPEISCILDVAGNLGLRVQRQGTGNAKRMVVLKPRN